MGSLVMEFQTDFKRNVNLYFHIKSLHTTGTGVVFCTPQGLFRTTIHPYSLTITPFQMYSFEAQARGQSYPLLCYPSGYALHSLKEDTGPWPSIYLPITLMEHSGKLNTDVDGLSNTLFSQFLGLLKFHDMFSTPP